MNVQPIRRCSARGRFPAGRHLVLACFFFFLVAAGPPAQAQPSWPVVVLSADGTPISCEVSGEGEPTLIFVHGWSCDARYWREQAPYFSRNHRVVLLDLAGHGHSGMARRRYTMRSFGEDVRAVAEAAGGKKIVLVGHSMGGSVIAEAARLLPGRVVGLIGVDTLENIEYPLTRRAFQKMIAPLRKNFPEGTRQFVQPMLAPDGDPKLSEWILSDMAAGPRAVGLSAMEEMMRQYITGEAAKIFEEVRVPVVCVNADAWPVNAEANRRHMLSFDAIILPKADHFLMLNRPEEFNRALEKAVRMITEKAGK